MSLNLNDGPRIRVLVVDDSAFMRTALARMIACEPDMEVVATASCASLAFEKISGQDPDVVTLDVNMPGLDGLGALRCSMNQFPRPVIYGQRYYRKGGIDHARSLERWSF